MAFKKKTKKMFSFEFYACTIQYRKQKLTKLMIPNMYFLALIIGSAYASGCNSNYQATFCPYPHCCDAFGNCGSSNKACQYYASDFQDSCYYANCQYCCYGYNGNISCGTFGYCLTWTFVGLAIWLVITITIIVLIVKKKQDTLKRMQKIQERAKEAEQSDLQRNIHNEKQRNSQLLERQEFPTQQQAFPQQQAYQQAYVQQPYVQEQYPQQQQYQNPAPYSQQQSTSSDHVQMQGIANDTYTKADL